MAAITRRCFLQTAAAAATALPPVARFAYAAEAGLHVACNQFCWTNMYGRKKKDFNANLDAGLAEVRRSGVDGLEPTLGSPAAAEEIIPLLKKHSLAMRSCYAGGTLHEAAKADAAVANIVATAAKAKEMIDLGIVVVNPAPLGGQGKSDEQLAIQANAMTELGRRLAELKIMLAYHFHAPEWKDGGREFYHVMGQTDPKLVKLCLDTHWVYRGTGNNAEKVYEVLDRYADRTVELHLRQSNGGIWTEYLTEGDIDYVKAARMLKAKGVKPLLVLEQAVEQGTPDTMDAVESHRRSRAYAVAVFAGVCEA